MNDKVKSLFFSQYFKQPVQCSTERPNEHFKCLPEFVGKEWYLLLRDISQLLDSEAIVLVSIAMYHPKIEDYDPAECASGDGDYNLDGSFWIEASCRCWDGTLASTPSFTFSLIDDNDVTEPVYNQIGCTDYLRSIGILAPFTYMPETNQPITLTPAEIINLGWAKLQSNEQ